MVIAIYGGSFNPPHIGHALVAQLILWTGEADQVVFVPSANHPFGKEHAPFDARVQMLTAMCLDVDPHRVKVSTVEAEDRFRGRPVYTYDLLSLFREERPEDDIRFVIGTDILMETHRWHLWDKVREEFGLIVLGREGYISPEGAITLPDYSSSEVRRLLAAGDEGWERMVTPGVRAMLPGPYSSSS